MKGRERERDTSRREGERGRASESRERRGEEESGAFL